MQDAHRTAIKKDIRVLIGYLRVVEAWLDADYPGSAHATMETTRPVITSLEVSLRSAASQEELDFTVAEKPQKTKTAAGGHKKKPGGK